MEDADFNEFFDELDDQETEKIIKFLVDAGAAEWDGMGIDGERLYKFNMEILNKVMPSLHDQIMEDIDETMIDLFQKDLVNVEYNENLEAIFKISEQGKEVLKELGIDYLFDDEK